MQGEKRVVFFGDSITDGWGTKPGTGTFFSGKPYVNRGISGADFGAASVAVSAGCG